MVLAMLYVAASELSVLYPTSSYESWILRERVASAMLLSLILGDVSFEISIYGLSFKSTYYKGAGGLSS